jgi:hypothetical protein
VIYDYWVSAKKWSVRSNLCCNSTLFNSGCVGTDTAIEGYGGGRCSNGENTTTSVSLFHLLEHSPRCFLLILDDLFTQIIQQSEICLFEMHCFLKFLNPLNFELPK